MDKLKAIGQIGPITVQLDTSDPNAPVLILNDNAQAERLAALLSPDPNQPLDLDWRDCNDPDGTILRVTYTPAVDRRIADIINALLAVYYAVPSQVRNEAKP